MSWFGENGWWLLPSVFGVAWLALLVRRWRARPSTREFVGRAVRTVLTAFALLLTYTAFTLRAWPAMAVAFVMIACLSVPFSKGGTTSSPVRYATYFGLFLLYLAAFPDYSSK